MNREQYPQQNTARMEKILRSSSEYGLSSKEAKERLKKYGKNHIFEERKHPAVAFALFVIKNGSLPIALVGLCVAAVFLGVDVLMPALLYLLFLAVCFALFCWREKNTLIQRSHLIPRVRVVRDGKKRSISPEMLVTGDLILLAPGDVLYTYAHITTDEEIAVYGHRPDGGGLFTKHGGDCFDGTSEPFNTLCPGDMIREGMGAAFVTEKAQELALPQAPSETVENYGNICKITTRVSLFIAAALLVVAVLRGMISEDHTFLGEGILLFSLLISTAGTAFYPLLFDLLFLHKNKRMRQKDGALLASISDAESLATVDAFVLSTRSMFRSARCAVKCFETASGKHIKEKMRGTNELSLIADLLFAAKNKCTLSVEEEAALEFSTPHSTGRRFDLYAKSATGLCTLTSYRSLSEEKNCSFVWGDAEFLIPKLVYLSENGRTRLLDAKQRDRMLAGVRHSKKSGYRFLLFAETKTRNTPEGMPQSFSELKLLGLFAMRKVTDAQATATLEFLKREQKKAVFIHEGENAEWLTREIRHFDGIPILDGSKETFREELTYYVQSENISFCIGIHISAFQRAQIVTVLESAGRHVAAYGAGFEDHRMLCAATAAIVPFHRENVSLPPLVAEAAAVRADEHVSAQVNSVESASCILGGFGAFTAALCASLLGRCAVALIGILFGKIFLDSVYYAVLGIGFDLFSVFCFMGVDGKKRYSGMEGLLNENKINFSFFAGFLGGSLLIGALAAYVALAPESFSFTPGCFVFVSLLLMLNVGMWRFSVVQETTAKFLYPLVSVAAMILPFLLGHFTAGRYGFLFRLDLLFWALFPIAVLLAVGKLSEIYFAQKNTLNIGENNERM